LQQKYKKNCIFSLPEQKIHHFLTKACNKDFTSYLVIIQPVASNNAPISQNEKNEKD
jgi:hypothetical protein